MDGDAWAYVVPCEEELREAFALALYGMMHGVTPTVALCVLPARPRGGALDGDGPFPDAVHVLTRYEPSFTVLGPDFVDAYRAHVHERRNTPFYVTTDGKETLQLVGFGSTLAAATILDDRDVVGASGSNIGYVVDSIKRVCRVVKIDAGGAFEFRINSGAGETRAGRSVVYNRGKAIAFSELTAADQEEFITVLRDAVIDLHPKSGVFEMMYASLFAGRMNHRLTLPRGYVNHLRDGLRQRLTRVVVNFSSEIERSAELYFEGQLADAVAIPRGAGDDELSYMHDVVTKDVEISKRYARLRGYLSRITDKKFIVEAQCETFQLPPLPVNFISRGGDLEAVRNALVSMGRVVLTGISGVGKSTVAARYARLAAFGGLVGKEKLSYAYVAWLRAEHALDLDEQYLGLAEIWCGLPTNGVSVKEAKDAVWHFLGSTTRRSLLVFDNMTSITELRTLTSNYSRQALGGMHLIVTTRDLQSHNNICAVPHPLSMFSPQASADLLRVRFPHASNNLLRRCHDALGGLPLALSQAVAYMRLTNTSLEKFLQDFRGSQGAEMLQRHGVLEDDQHPRTIGTLLGLCLAYLNVSVPDAARILECAAFLHADELHAEVLAKAAGLKSQQVGAALRTLQQLGMFASTKQKDAYNVHHVVQFCVRHRLQQLGAAEAVLTRVMVTLITFLRGSQANNAIRAAVTLSANFCLALEEDVFNSDKEATHWRAKLKEALSATPTNQAGVTRNQRKSQFASQSIVTPVMGLLELWEETCDDTWRTGVPERKEETASGRKRHRRKRVMPKQRIPPERTTAQARARRVYSNRKVVRAKRSNN